MSNINQCPKCNRYMSLHITYSCGMPTTYYTCICGYDSRYDQKTYVTADTSTTYENQRLKNGINND